MQDRNRVRPFRTVGKQPRLSAYHQILGRPLAEIVVYRQVPIAEIRHQAVPLAQRILDRPP